METTHRRINKQQLIESLEEMSRLDYPIFYRAGTLLSRAGKGHINVTHVAHGAAHFAFGDAHDRDEKEARDTWQRVFLQRIEELLK